MHKYTKQSLRESHRWAQNFVGCKIWDFQNSILRGLSFKCLMKHPQPRDDVSSSLG